MEKYRYMMMLKKKQDLQQNDKEGCYGACGKHRGLDDAGKIGICGVFKGYPGMAGMYILKTDSREEAEALCEQEPLVIQGYATYQLVTLQIADRENNYLL